MTLAPLADVSDLPAAWRDNEDAEKALRIASSSVRDAAGCFIDRNTVTVKTEGGHANLLTLPGPVVEVDTVTLDGTEVSPDAFEVLPNGLWRGCGWGGAPVPVVVTYTGGVAVVPEDVVDLCAQLATAWLQHQAAGGGSTAGLTSVRLDDAAEAYSDEAAGQISPVFIPEATRIWLAGRFGGLAAVVETL